MLERALVSVGRLIGKPRGWERTVRMIAPPEKLRGRVPYFKKMPEGYVFFIDPGTLIGWNVHFFGTYEPEVCKQIDQILRPGMVAFDVGANVGWHTLRMASAVAAEGKVFAFEPNATTRQRLAIAVEKNHYPQVEIHEEAMADHEGLSPFAAPPAGDVWDGTGRLMAGHQGAQQIVTCTTIDNFAQEKKIQRLDLLKIDVEGWEISVLKGARTTLARLRPKMIFEFDPAYIGRCGGTEREFRQVLKAYRYILFYLGPGDSCRKVEGLGNREGNYLALPSEQG